MHDTTQISLRDAASRMKWFHALDLGGFQTSGRFPQGRPQNITLFPVIDLLQYVDVTGLTCLDVGTAHGLTAFGLKLRGAERVVATDTLEDPAFLLARRALQLDVEYLPRASISTTEAKLPGQQFDLVVIAGVIYHMLNPMDAILKARRLVKPYGLLVLESAYDPTEERPVLELNAESARYSEINTYWMPSRTAMLGMLRLAGFNPLAERYILRPGRLAIIARNVPFAEVENRTALCARMHELKLCDPESVSVPVGEQSPIKYVGPRDVQKIDQQSYVPNWPPHPKRMDNVVGTTAWIK